MRDEIKWNSALQDLQLLSEIEQKAIEYNIDNNVEMFFKLLKAYFQKLCSMVEFDRSGFLQEFETVKKQIYSLDVNKDGRIDEWEMINAAVTMGKAKETLENMYYELSSIKVNSGLSVQKVYYEDALKRLKEGRARKEAAVLDMK